MVGEQHTTRAKFLENYRVRYAQLANFYPRPELPGYWAPIKPEPGKAQALERGPDGAIDVAVVGTGTEIEARYRAESGKSLIIDCRGFETSASTLYSQLSSTILEPKSAADQGFELIVERGVTVRYEQGSNATQPVSATITSIRELGAATREIQVAYTYGSGEVDVVTEQFTGDKARARIAQQLFGDTRVREVSRPGAPLTAAPYQNDKLAFPLGSKVDGHDIYVIGPAAGLRLSDAERNQTEITAAVFDKRGENAVAMFVHVPKAVALARQMAAMANDPENKRRSSLLQAGTSLEYRFLPDTDPDRLRIDLKLPQGVERKPSQEGLDLQTSLKMALGTGLYDSLFPETFAKSGIKIRVLRLGDELKVSVDSGGSNTPAYSDLYKSLFSRPDLISVLEALTDPKLSKRAVVELELPLTYSRIVPRDADGLPRGRVTVGEISVRTRKINEADEKSFNEPVPTTAPPLFRQGREILKPSVGARCLVERVDRSGIRGSAEILDITTDGTILLKWDEGQSGELQGNFSVKTGERRLFESLSEREQTLITSKGRAVINPTVGETYLVESSMGGEKRGLATCQTVSNGYCSTFLWLENQGPGLIGTFTIYRDRAGDGIFETLATVPQR
jgi:hypothetical protein